MITYNDISTKWLFTVSSNYMEIKHTGFCSAINESKYAFGYNVSLFLESFLMQLGQNFIGYRQGRRQGILIGGGGQNIYFGENSCASAHARERVSARIYGWGPGGGAPGSSRFLGYQTPQIVIYIALKRS